MSGKRDMSPITIKSLVLKWNFNGINPIMEKNEK